MQVQPVTDGITFLQLFLSLAGGILPTILWLWLWLKEDTHPEPRKRIMIAFLGGMVAVPLVIPFEIYTQSHIANIVVVIIIWAAIEELFKFGAAFATSLTRKENNQPIEPLIYLITTALGFAAFENVLYLITPLHTGDLILSLNTENLRFIGANLIHLVSSSAIGVSLGLAFCKGKWSKFTHFLVGFSIAVALHSLFNLFIMKDTSSDALGIFFLVWISVVVLALFFEKIKTVVCLVRPQPATTIKPTSSDTIIKV